jgi:hypothetical protein
VWIASWGVREHVEQHLTIVLSDNESSRYQLLQEFFEMATPWAMYAPFGGSDFHTSVSLHDFVVEAA